jgi:[protein-PII] uridylyltransferase
VSVTPTPSEQSPTLNEVRAGVLRRPGLVGVEFRIALTDAYDDWLAGLVPQRSGLELVAVGGLGREEPAPFSDLDLVLLHDGKVDNLAAIADEIWYPIWDGGIGLDHSVRTVDEALGVAKGDLKALLGLLDVRHIAGDDTLWGPLRARVLDLWRAVALKRFDELRELCQARWELLGEAAFLLEPNLKDAKGGMRDAHLLHALAVAQLIDFPVAVREAYPTLLDVRGELQRRTARADDVLRTQELDGVAEALGMLDDNAEPDRDRVLRMVNESARSIGYEVDVAWRRIADSNRARTGVRRFFPGNGPDRVGLARDVVAQDGEVTLARDVDAGADPSLLMRVARAAAENALPISAFTLRRLAEAGAPVPFPWPDAIRADFVSLLGAGMPAVHVLESLDQVGVLERFIPEWPAVRCRAQHNPVHRFTVDRHLLETAANATAHTRTVTRPDLLVIGALLHDIGKGFPGGDHSVVGAEHAARIAARMGFDAADAEQVTAMVRHHLLLPDTATRRDLDDPLTVNLVAESVGGSAELLDLLHALTIADAAATGPAVWSDWKAGLIADLVRRTHLVLTGTPQLPIPPLDDERLALAAAGELAVVAHEDSVVVAAPDEVGILYRTAGVLALHSLDVRSASISTHAGMAVNTFVVEPRFGRLPDPALIRGDLARALDGTMNLAQRLEDKERAYARQSVTAAGSATVLWFDDQATDATVLEIRTGDTIGLLYRLTAALERCRLDVRSARVSSSAGTVVDAFYVTTRSGERVPHQARPAIEAELRSV